jgi:carbon storage regulator CsrA
MLVLSRRPQQKVLFPGLGISVEILSVQGQIVRVGVQAPREVAIWRDEIAPADAAATGITPQRRESNRLAEAGTALTLAQRQLSQGVSHEAEQTLQHALATLEKLEQRRLAAPRARAAAPKRNLKALLVEDNRNESTLLASYLRLNGITVETADDGADALEYLAAHERPDVVLLDMRLPRFDGPATVAAIRSDPSLQGLKVFAVTGTSQAELDIPIGPSGVDRWFTKPINPPRLIEEMSGLLPSA